MRLSAPFLAYLRGDGIVLPPEANERRNDWSDTDSGVFSSAENNSDGDGDDDDDNDPSLQWEDVHEAIQATIRELGGTVVPKLNWSAPKDATWIAATNSLECRTPNDIYLLLKSSDFVTHDLEHAFDGCVDASAPDAPEIPYCLVLRKYFQLNPSLEFRCFVRGRRLLALCQRDLNHFDFLFKMRDELRGRVQEFFDDWLARTFPDGDFTFDVYVPPPHDRVWLIDINPWDVRTDPLLFSWLEILTMAGPHGDVSVSGSQRDEEPEAKEEAKEEADEEADEEVFVPEFRLVGKDDPEAYSFNTSQYSAHKLPREVVDASKGPSGSLRDFAAKWEDILAKRVREEDEDSSDTG